MLYYSSLLTHEAVTPSWLLRELGGQRLRCSCRRQGRAAGTGTQPVVRKRTGIGIQPQVAFLTVDAMATPVNTTLQPSAMADRVAVPLLPLSCSNAVVELATCVRRHRAAARLQRANFVVCDARERRPRTRLRLVVCVAAIWTVDE